MLLEYFEKTVIGASIFCLFLTILSCTPAKNEKVTPNVVLIFVDDMGYSDLACYGHPTIKTPHLDQMAREGIRFTSFYVAASVCTPSRASLLTGRYPIRNLPRNVGPESQDGLPVSEITLADILKKAGYNTAAIGKWHLGHQPQYLPTSRGFDSFYGLPYSNDMILPWCPWLTEDHKLELYEDSVKVKEVGFEQEDLTGDYTQQAINFIHANKDQPFFLYLAHSMPHLPISTSPEFIGKSKAGLYGDVIQTIDWSVGEILSTLSELGIDNNTIVLFTSDNGPWHNLPERMVQRGVQPWHTGSTGLLRGAKGTTYEGGFRVPAIVRWPNYIPESQVCDEMVTAMDWFTTLVDITGGELPKDKEIDGNNIFSLMQGEGNSPTKKFFYLLSENVQAVRKDAWKLRITQSDSVELYNLKLDPGEMYNQAVENPQVVNELWQELREFSDNTNARTEIPN